MAARNFSNTTYSLQRDVVNLFLKGVGAGAADLTGVLTSTGIKSVHETGTGAYDITLTDKYNSLLMASFNVIDAGTIDDWEVVLATDLTNSNVISIQVFKGGTATDLTTSQTLIGKISLSNTQRPV